MPNSNVKVFTPYDLKLPSLPDYQALQASCLCPLTDQLPSSALAAATAARSSLDPDSSGFGDKVDDTSDAALVTTSPCVGVSGLDVRVDACKRNHV